MGTIIKEALTFCNKREPPQNCTDGFPASRISIPLGGCPLCGKSAAPVRNVFAGQRAGQLSDADRGWSRRFLWSPVEKTSSCRRTRERTDLGCQESFCPSGGRALIGQILSGHRELFMDLIRPHQRTVYATVFSLLAHKEDAEDVAQDTFVKALARLHQFRQESSFGTWLVQIAINEARMRNRNNGACR